MIDIRQLLLFLVISGCVTFLSRELPFIIFSKRKIPNIILYLGKVLPMSVMCILVLYCIKGTNFQSASGFLPQIISLAVVILIHLWKRNTTASIFVGTALYMLLIRII